jgi:hypothetical protein
LRQLHLGDLVTISGGGGHACIVETGVRLRSGDGDPTHGISNYFDGGFKTAPGSRSRVRGVLLFIDNRGLAWSHGGGRKGSWAEAQVNQQ